MKTKFNRQIFAAAVLSVLLAFCLNVQKAGAQQLALKANALTWAALTPSIGIEGVVGEKTSVGLMFMGHINPYGIKSKFLACQPEFRYWFGGRPLVREFIGVTAAAVAYNTTLRGQVYDGYSFVAGLTGGYAFNLGKRWNLELTAGLGIATFFHKQYSAGDNYPAYERPGSDEVNSHGYRIIPVNLGITFSYIIL